MSAYLFVILIGLGVQVRERLAVAGPDVVATIDPVVEGADHRDAGDAALVCTPDAARADLLGYLLGRGKHVFVEKPLPFHSGLIRELGALAPANRAALYTAYNHRFEPRLVGPKRVLEDGAIGVVHFGRFIHGHGTAVDVRGPSRRDEGLGALPDIGSRGVSLVQMEATPPSWRNTFAPDVYGDSGGARVNGLCKWGPCSLSVRKRVFPSGKPTETVHTIESPDPTWGLEYEHFQRPCRNLGSNFENDVSVGDALEQLALAVGQGVRA